MSFSEQSIALILTTKNKEAKQHTQLQHNTRAETLEEKTLL